MIADATWFNGRVGPLDAPSTPHDQRQAIPTWGDAPRLIAALDAAVALPVIEIVLWERDMACAVEVATRWAQLHGMKVRRDEVPSAGFVFVIERGEFAPRLLTLYCTEES